MSKIKFEYVDSHKSEYWYICDECGATDWFSHYGRPSNLNECLPTCKNKANTSKEFDALVFIGRFSPFHNGHKSVVDTALEKAKEVIIVVGSSFQARNIRNPFTFDERREMIKAVYPQDNVKVVPVSDYPYDDSKWITAVQNVVFGAMSYTPDPIKIGLIGHSKDNTSYYLKIFPTWGNVEVPNFKNINATDIRNRMLGDGFASQENFQSMPEQAYNTLLKLVVDNATPGKWWHTLFNEFSMIKKYKESWKAAPYPPTFVTVDAVVVQSGHLLLVKRGHAPGIGLWALPGGFLNQEETMLDGCIRELREETKIKVPVPVLKGSIKESKTFDAPNRSTRGRTITQAFYIDLGFAEDLPKVKGSDDAIHAAWIPLSDVVKMRDQFFEDHFHIISHFLKIG